MSSSGGKMKLKLNTAQATASSPKSAVDPTPTPSTSIKLNFGKLGAGSPPATQQPAEQKPPAAATPKSAKKKVASSASSTPAASKSESGKQSKTTTPKQAKQKIIRLNSQSGPSTAPPAQRKPSLIRLHSTKPAASPSTGSNPRLRLKRKGQLPPRPPGAGYDSEAEDAEEDPAIEENLILRMPPGPDCDYVHNAIQEKKIGLPLAEGGADISMHFFSPRRAAIKVRGRTYAAVVVDLPCIVETMKSWDRKGWWKSADISQMILVTRQVAHEDEARNGALPPEVDQNTWQWPHGLTPPMHNVRKRRFRKRVSHRTIEQAEEEVERLLAEDEETTRLGGTVRHELLDWEQLRREEEGDDNEEDADGEMDLDSFARALDDNEEDDEDWAAAFEARMGEDDNADVPDTPAAAPAPANPPPDATTTTTTQPTPLPTDSQAPTPAAEDVEMVDSPARADAQSDAQPQDSQPQTPANARTSSDEDEDEDDEDDDEDEEDDDDEDVDDETRERLQLLTQQREEIAHLERQIAERREQLAKQTNPLLKAKLMATIKRFEEERDVKKRGLGVTEDDDDDDD